MPRRFSEAVSLLLVLSYFDDAQFQPAGFLTLSPHAWEFAPSKGQTASASSNSIVTVPETGFHARAYLQIDHIFLERIPRNSSLANGQQISHISRCTWYRARNLHGSDHSSFAQAPKNLSGPRSRKNHHNAVDR